MKNNVSVNEKDVRKLRKNLFKIPLIFISVIFIIFTLISCKSKDKITSKVNGPKQVVTTKTVATTPITKKTSDIHAVFNKSATDIMADLRTVDQSQGTAIPVDGATGAYNGLLTYHTISATLGGMYGIPITATNDFHIVSSVEEKATPNDWQNLVVYMDVDFVVKDNSSVESGTYNAKGQCKVTYKLDTDKNKWEFSYLTSSAIPVTYMLRSSKK